MRLGLSAIPWLIGALVASLGTNALLGGLWLGARERVAEERSACNETTLQASLEAERIARVEDRKAHASRVAQLEQQIENLKDSIVVVHDVEREARMQVEERDRIINDLMEEAWNEEIPDSSECLNVFVPRRTIDCLQPTVSDSAEAGAGAGARNRSLCADTCAVSSPDPACSDFSDVTYGDAIKLWGMDRDTITILNRQLSELAALESQ